MRLNMVHLICEKKNSKEVNKMSTGYCFKKLHGQEKEGD